MIVVLDPALFWTRSPDGPLSAAEVSELEICLDHAVRICRDASGRIPSEPSYWGRIQKEMIAPLLKRSPARSTVWNATTALRGLAGPLGVERPRGPGKTRMWNVRPLFAWAGLPAGWFEVMEQLLWKCALAREPCLLVSRLIDGRNQRRHATGRCELEERLFWRVYVHASGAPPRSIPCVTHPTNLTRPWTARFDHRLPGPEDGARYPFCPPDRWWRKDVQAHGTAASKPAWLDRSGNAWARPATGGGHHWDVFIADVTTHERIGLDQLNIVEWGAPASEGRAGDIHHVPTGKMGRLKSDTGWTCA